MATSKKPIAKKKPVAAKPAPAKKPAVKEAPAKPASTKAPAHAAAPAKSTSKVPMSAADIKKKLLERKSAGPAKSIAFSLDEVREIAKKNEKVIESSVKTDKAGKTGTAAKNQHLAVLEKAQKPHHVKTASLADILGFNPKRGKPTELMSDKDVPEKFKRYYKLLLDLRTHLTEGIERHSEETLKRSAKDDAGDLSAYGQHMADAGTDTFDRDFALSLVSSEQEALSEVEAAITRIKDGTYGTCEMTQKPIAKERLLAVPFTRYSAEAQKNIERNRHRSRTQAGLFGELGEEGAALSAGGGGDDGDE